MLAALVEVFVAAGGVHAQPAASEAEADRLFQEARDLVKANRWAEACPIFEQSLRDDPALGTRLNLATCYEHVGQLARAWGLYRESARIAEQAGDAERRDFAKTQADALEPRLAKLVISAPTGLPAGFVVTRDSAAIDDSTLGVAVYVDAGRHEIAASAPGFVAFTKVVTLVAGKTETIAIPSLPAGSAASEAAKAPDSAAADATERPRTSASSTRVYAAVGLGAGGLAMAGVGLVFGANARSNLRDAKLLCGAELVCEGNNTYRLGQQLIQDARTKATISTILVATGGAAIVAGAVLYFTRPSTRESRATKVVPVLTSVALALPSSGASNLMPRIVLALPLLIASAACSTTLGLNDVTRGDGGEGELDMISALEDKVATLQASQAVTLAALKPVAFRASLGTPQIVHNATATNKMGTVVLFDTVQLDTHSKFDRAANQYVVPVPGQYIVTAIVGYMGLTTGRANCEIWVDRPSSPSSSETAVSTPGTTGADLVRVTSTTAVQLDAGDRVYVKAFHDNSGDATLLAEPRSTNLQIIMIPTVK